MKEQLPPMDRELAALVHDAGPVAPPKGFADDVWGRLDLSALPVSVAAAPQAAPVAKGLAGAKLAVAGLVAVTLGAAGGAALDRLLTEPPPPQIIVKEVRVEVPAPLQPPPAPAAPAAPRPRPAASRFAPVHTAVETRPEPPAPTPAELDAQLREERALLEVARTALARQDAAGARARLEEHQRRFPAGRLSEERDGLWITALEALGEHAQASARAKAFLERYPESLLAPQLKRIAGQ